MRQLKDYIHLYIGCECESNIQYSYVGGGGSNQGAVFAKEINGNTIGYIIDALKKKERDQAEGWSDSDHIFCRLLLRPLSDLTEEEIEFMWIGMSSGTEIRGEIPNGNTVFFNVTPIHIQYLLSIGIDLFGLIDAGLAINAKDTHNQTN